jgi:hypothetical protein
MALDLLKNRDNFKELEGMKANQPEVVKIKKSKHA